MVPTSLGMNLIHLFGDDSGETSPALLPKPIIKKMQDEVKQIASGSKEECLKTDLDWFEARYQEFARSLSRERVGDFAKGLAPTKESIKAWKEHAS
jgi:hypothetical protein